MCKFLLKGKPPLLSYEVSSSIDILSNQFDLTPVDANYVKQIAEQVWPERRSLFGKSARYENVILGIILYIIENDNVLNRIPTNMSDFIEEYYPSDYESHRIKVYSVAQILNEIFTSHIETGGAYS